jgi:uncharacterized protein (DUF433 family)
MKNQVRTKATTGRIELGEHIVADPRICHGKPTFKGTRIMVWQVLEDVADGKSWDFISQVRWGGRLSVAAIAEAVRLAQRAFLDPEGNLLRKPGRERSGEPITV